VKVKDLMQAEVLQTFPQEVLADAAARMNDHQVGSLMVIDGDRLVAS
jgi:CBS domain-containing protein